MRADTLARAERALRDPSRTRIVARMRLRLPAHEDEAPARRTLEDALNSAEFDDCGRLVVVRALVLPPFPVWASSAWVARTIETAWRAQAASAVHASSGEAASARTVFFRDLTEARLELMQALIAGGAGEAWFWPLAVPEFVPGAPRNEAIVRVLTALVCEPGAPGRPGLAALGAHTMTWSVAHLRTFLDALPAQPPSAFGVHANRVASIDPPEQAAWAEPALPMSASAVENTARIERHDAIRRLALVFASGAGIAPVDDWRNVLLAEALLRADAASSEAPAPQAVREVLRAAARLAVAERATDRTPRNESPQRQHRPGEANPQPAPSSPTASLEDRAPSLPGAGPPRLPLAHAQSAPAAAPAVARVQAPYLPWLEGAAATRFGGLLLVLNVFHRLGIDAWLGLQPAAGRNAFVTVLLADVARRLRIPSDDAHWHLLAAAPSLREALRESRWQWQGFDWPAWSRLDAVTQESVDFERSVSHWVRALRQVLRRRCGIGLATLAQREAWLSATSTHVDLVFALNAIDLRVRRAGLDGNPGWLPWFGHIVALHFIDGRSGSAPDV